MHWWCIVFRTKNHLRYFVTFYFWNSLEHLKLCPHKLWGVKSVLFTLVSSVGCEFKSKPLKFGLPMWIQNLISTQPFLAKLWISTFKFHFGEFIKMNFSNKLASTIVSLIGTKIVLTNGNFGWVVCQLINSPKMLS